MSCRNRSGGSRFVDGRPLFGRSKTIRGLVLSILVTTALAPLVGVEFEIGFAVALTAMAGDLFSSFLKRRMNLPPSSQAFGLDQIPESLFPALACRAALGLSALDLVAVVAIFFVGELMLSRLLFKWGVRDRPF
jgi:CDP-2,3-bis-(O-geranylgeranyl)-sn-glycerol synthase